MITGEGHDAACTPRLKALLVAYACVPGRGSEPGVGWNRAVETARRFDTWVLCNEAESAGPVQQHLADHGPIPGLHVVFVPRPQLERHIAQWPGLYYLSYRLWQRRAYRLARTLHERHRFDVVHQVTFCGYREPGYTWKLDAPFIWGPVGGTQNYPARFLLEDGLHGLMMEGARSLLNALQLRFSPRVRTALRRATIVFAANSTNRDDFHRVHGIVAPLLLETGLTHIADQPRPVESGRALRLLWSGDLAPHKGLPLLLRALAQMPASTPFELRVYGRGRYRRRWERLARRLNLHRSVTWMGWVPHGEALAAYEWADVFVFTSLRDTSGNVLLEALGAGVPVICLAHQGAGDIVTPACGVAVPVTTPREVIAGIRLAIAHVSAPEEARRLRAGALARAHQYLWSRNAEVMATAYRDAARRPVAFPVASAPQGNQMSVESGR